METRESQSSVLGRRPASPGNLTISGSGGDAVTTGHAFFRARNKVLRYLYEEGAIAYTHSASKADIAEASGLQGGDFQAVWDLMLRAALVEGTGSGLTGDGYLTPSGFDEARRLTRKEKK